MDSQGGGPATAAVARAIDQTDDGLAHDVFRLFPYGLVVLDRTGALLAANSAARDLLPEPHRGWEPHGARCCDLFGCEAGSGPLSGDCLTALTRQAGRRLPELRVDLPNESAVWIVAAPLGEEPDRIVVQVRSGDPRDRRRRTRPHWTAGAQLQISALGRTRVESREGPIGGAWLEQRPGQILKFLVCERSRVVTVEEIASAIWPDSDRRALGSVRHFVHELRDRLEPDRIKRAPSSFVTARQGGYTLDRARVRIDADLFEESARAGLAAFSEGDLGEAAGKLEVALELYGGDLFAEDPYHVWAFAERDRLRDLAARGLRVLVQLGEREGDLDSADSQLQRLAELEPYDPQVQRQLVEICLRRGRRSEAARRYGALRARMLHEFGEELDFELGDLNGAQSQMRLV